VPALDSNVMPETVFTHEGDLPVQVKISARHGQLTASTQERIHEKVEKLTRFLDRLTSIEVTVDLEHRDLAQVELHVTAEHSAPFVATDSAATAMAALDGAIHKIEQQLRKRKEKITGHRATGLKHLEGSEPAAE
jgi:putative sigma-54 modulation protein